MPRIMPGLREVDAIGFTMEGSCCVMGVVPCACGVLLFMISSGTVSAAGGLATARIGVGPREEEAASDLSGFSGLLPWWSSQGCPAAGRARGPPGSYRQGS